MEIIFLNEQDLSIIDHGYATDDYEIVLDALIPQKSSFVINKPTLNVELGDYLVVRDREYFYIGIVTGIEKQEDETTKVSTKDFLGILDVTVPVSSFTGSISQFLIDLIRSHFKWSGDAYQNLSYLTTQIDFTKTGILTYDADATANILDLVEEFSKTYGIRLAYELIISNGSITGICVKAVAVTKGITIRSDLGTITNLLISDANENSVNKIIFFPKSDNTSHTGTVSYYLLTNGTVSTLATSPYRIEKVRFKYQAYSDKDYTSLQTKATSALIDSSLEHSITFDFSFVTNGIEALADLSIGAFVEFITPLKTYETLVTKIKYKGTFDSAEITLGEYRVSLTDKLKLLDRRK